MSKQNMGAQARAARLRSGDTMIRLAQQMGYSTMAMLNMERGEPGTEALAQKVVGHYRGLANRKAPRDHIGVMMREMRDRAGHTQEQLAAAIGIDPEYMSKVECAPLTISRPVARRVFAFYGEDVSVIPGRAPRRSGEKEAA